MYYVNPLIEKLVRIYPDGNRNGLLRLDMNENPGGLPKDIVDKLVEKITPEFLSIYPDKNPLLESLARRHNLAVENFAITDGSEMALKYIFEVFGKPGCNLVSIFPTFEMYGVYANMYGVNHIKIDVDANFDFDINNILDAIDENTCIVSMLNPNNPAGRPYTDEEFLQVAEKTQSCGAILIIDEAYHYFYKNTQVDLINRFDHIIVLRTFSKLYSIAACRIGYAISNPRMIDLINRARPTFDTNSIAITFANALVNEEGLLESLIKIELEGRNYLMERLKSAGYEFYYGGGNYISIKTKSTPKIVQEKLLTEYKIAIKTSGYDILKDYIRVTTGDTKVMEIFMDALLAVDK